MSQDTVISVEHVAKSYRLGEQQQSYKTARDALVDAVRGVPNWFRRKSANTEGMWALDDVSFEVGQGQVVGIIGRNGAGKSTLLKILSRITVPTRGKLRYRGRMASLLEVGTGFHAELSGRDNIYLNGGILGMKRSEVARKFDEIVEFAEVARFLDTAVKHYSTGMYLRLAFAVMAHLEPDILIVDEVLAVGDAGFQKKCMGKMENVAKQGRTVLLVSHNMAAIRNLCTKSIVLNAGKVVFDGQTDEAIKAYNQFDTATSAAQVSLIGHPSRRREATPLLEEIRFLDVDGNPRSTFVVGETMVFEIRINPPEKTRAPAIGIAFDDTHGTRVFTAGTYFSTTYIDEIEGPTIVRCVIDGAQLAPGNYKLTLSAGSQRNWLVDVLDGAVSLQIDQDDYFGNGAYPKPMHGLAWQRSNWSVVPGA